MLGSFLRYYKELKTENHVMWGIIEKKECKICKNWNAHIQLQDPNNIVSPKIETLIAFIDNFKVPNLLGMKCL